MAIRDALLLLIFLGSLPVCFIRPFYGVLMWTIVAFLNPQSYLWGTVSFFPWALAVAIPTLIGGVLFSAFDWHALFSRKVFFIVLLWAWFTVTSFVANGSAMFSHHSIDTWDRWKFVSKILLMTLVTIAVVNSYSRLRVLLLVIGGSFGFYVAKAFPFIIATGGVHRVYGADNNDFGLALNMTLPIYYFLAQAEENPWMKRVLKVLFFITIPSILCTYSRGAVVGLVVVMACLLWYSRRRLLLIPVIVAVAVGTLMFAPEHWIERMNPQKENALDGSAKSRLNNWTFAWRLASDNPVFGGGFATFTPELYERYSPAPTRVYGPHSVYFQVLGEHGFTGIVLYFIFLGGAFFGARRIAKRASRLGDLQAMEYAKLCGVALIAFAASGTFLGRAYFDYLFTIAACVVILDRLTRENWSEDYFLNGQPMEEETEDDEAGVPAGVYS
jgi:probable O-glycosylation ligase (exosortase A-associated)